MLQDPRRATPPPLIGVPALAAVQYLVDAAALPSAPVAVTAPRLGFKERTIRIIELFERQAAHGRAYR